MLQQLGIAVNEPLDRIIPARLHPDRIRQRLDLGVVTRFAAKEEPDCSQCRYPLIERSMRALTACRRGVAAV